ncbi:ExbD/TolR family protein [Erythrobacter sp. MTPC3]|uniref:ExbD/TolR family protein n=1 Tax=Erythrobacter sp. MTPC3 TaxID=3056564 RepID=UPI0036F3C7F5
MSVRGRTGRRTPPPELPISRIDIRPIAIFAAILAVLTLLWNAATPRTHTLLVDLPYVSHPLETAFAPAYLTVELAKDGAVFLNGSPIALRELSQAIQNAGIDYPTVLFSPHPDAAYGKSAEVLAAIAAAGVHSSEICFDRLQRYQMFDRVYFIPPRSADGTDALGSEVSLIVPSGCEQFFQGSGEVI